MLWTVELEKTLESPLDCREIQPVHPKGDQSVLNIHWKNCCWSWNSNTLATWCDELTHWKRPWRWEGLGAGGEGDDRGWDGWMASLTPWTWVWVNSRSWWWTGRPGVLRFMGLQRVGHDWASELNWTELNVCFRATLLICSPSSTVSTSLFSVCNSVAALQIGSSVPFSGFHIYVLIYDIYFSDLLHSV